MMGCRYHQSALRVTHIPTGESVTIEDRCPHHFRVRARALALLRSRLWMREHGGCTDAEVCVVELPGDVEGADECHRPPIGMLGRG